MAITARQKTAAAAGPLPQRSVLALFVLTLFTGALLIFWIQPLVAKMLLPFLGGSPAVWITSMVFFQAALLAGYLYAHMISTRLQRNRQLVIHMVAILLAATFLPVVIESGWTPSESASPTLWLFGVLLGTIGIPFVVVSSTAPLLQHWFSGTSHPHASDPYFLYAASNVGSIVGLLAFPLFLEPLMTLRAQSVAWTGIFAVLACFTAACGLLNQNALMPKEDGAESPPVERTSWRERIAWLAYAAVPSSLLLGVTNHITTDLAAAPLLWVLPLILYLLSFVIVFARRPIIPHVWALRALPFCIVLLAGQMTYQNVTTLTLPVSIVLLLHLFVFFAVCLACHGELVRRRPVARNLTKFYIYLSFGGMLGGAGTALLAPLIFDGVYEYPLALIAACLLMPSRWLKPLRFVDMVFAASIIGLFMLWRELPILVDMANPARVAIVLLLAAVPLLARARPAGFGLCIAALFLAPVLAPRDADIVWRDRSFFGVHRVAETADGRYRLLYHGTTLHGAQHLDPSRLLTPTTYYAPDSPIAELIEKVMGRARLRSVGLVGLGAGSLVCYRRPDEDWTYFEIDPLVTRIASTPSLFSFLQECGSDVPVIHGDGRLALTREENGRFGLLVIDAFSSNAIPVHLLTLEAVDTYFDKLAPDGVLALHISNRNLNLHPVISRTATELGLTGRVAHKPPIDGDRYASMGSHWVILARHQETIERLALDQIWQPLPADDGGRVWTDDYSNILETIRWWQ